jgi:hypothetical protein
MMREPARWQAVHVGGGACWPDNVSPLMFSRARPTERPHCPTGLGATWRCISPGRCRRCGAHVEADESCCMSCRLTFFPERALTAESA